MFNQMKMAKKMMENMSPDEIKDLMKQAKDSQKMLDEQIEKKVRQIISELNLVSRDEVMKMISEEKNIDA